MRPLLSKGDIIQVNSTKYRVEECIGLGNQAAVYRCVEPGNTRKACCVKEFIPTWVERRSRSTQSDYKPIIIPRDRRDEWLRLKDSVKHSETLVREFADESIQAHYLTEESDFERMTFKMPQVASSCQKLSDLWEIWKIHPPTEKGDNSELPRIKKSAEIVLSLAKAMKNLHSHQFIHGDLTPTNVFFSDEHTVAFPIDFACCSKIGYPSEDFTFHSPGYSHPLRKDASVHIDLYSLAALFIAMGTGGYCMANSKTLKVKDLTIFENIHDSVSRIAIPNGVKAKFEVIVANAAEASNTPYTSATQLVDDLELLLEIIDRRGMHPEVLFDASETEFKEQCYNENGIFHYELQEDLVTEAVDIDSKTPVDILAQNTILLGGGGSGKTTKIRTLWKQCLSDWKKDRKNNPIPVYVPLNTFDSKKSNWDFFIRDYITEVYFPDLSENVKDRRADLLGLFNSTGVILFLDGINEAVDPSMLNAEIAKLAAIKNVTVIITSRNDWGDDETKKLFSTAELIPLNDDLILRKLQENNLGSPSARLLETLRRPMFLALYLRIKITDSAVETAGQILLAHHKHLFDAYKTGHHGEDMEALFLLLIHEMFPQVATSINGMRFNLDIITIAVESIPLSKNHRPKLLVLGIDEYQMQSGKSAEGVPTNILVELGKMSLASKLIEKLKDCGLIRAAVNKDEYIFSHQYYLEFYQAYDVYLQMQAYSKGSQLPKALSAGILPDTVTRFLGDIFAEYRWERETKPPSAIEKWLRENTLGKKDEAAQIVIRNLIETMKVARNGHISADYGGLDLSLVNFKNCNLTGSKFNKAVLPDAAFQRIGHYKTADQVAFVPGKSWILSSSCREKEIYIWNYRLGILVDRIHCEENVLGFDVSEDGSYVAAKEQSNGNYLAEVFDLVNRKRMRRIPFSWPDFFTVETLDERISESNTTLCDLRTQRDSLLDEDEMLQKAQTAVLTFLRMKPIYESLQQLESTDAQEKYRADYSQELQHFHEAQQYLVRQFPSGRIDRQQLAIRRSEIKIHFEGILDRIEYHKQQLDKLLTLKSSRTSQRYWDAVIRFGKSNKLICSFGPNGTDEICIWDIIDTDDAQPSNKLPIRIAYKNPDCMTRKCVLSYDRKDLFCLSEDGQLVAVNLESGRFQKFGTLLIENDLGFALTRNADGLLFVNGQDTLCFFDLQQKTITPLCEMVISLPVATKDYLVWAQGSFLFGWDVSNKQQEQYSVWGIACLCADSAGEKVAFATADGRIRIGDLDEKRISIDFSCGLGELYSSPDPNLIDLSGLFQETKAVSWNASGLIRQRYRDQACCLSGNIGHIISFPRSYFNTFDGSHTISAEIRDCANAVIETGSSGQRYICASEKIAVRDIETGALVAEAPWTPVCIAKGKDGEEFFRERSGIRWAKYLPDHKKIVIGMNLALVRIWNVDRQMWTEIGNWDTQIQKITELPDVKDAKDIGRKAWQLSSSCTVMGNHIITGTVDGHILFWNLDGELIKDVPAHDTMPDTVFEIPMSSLFLSAENGTMCIWDYKSAQMVDSGKAPRYVTEQNIIGICDCASWQLEQHSIDYHEIDGTNLVIIAERYDEIILIGCGYREASQANMGLLSVHTKMHAISCDYKKVAFVLGSSIEVYSLETCQLISEIDLPEPHLFNITDVCFSPNGDSLAIVYSDARILIFDLEHNVSRLWDVVSASNILHCDFTDAIMSEKTRTLLQQNGASF